MDGDIYCGVANSCGLGKAIGIMDNHSDQSTEWSHLKTVLLDWLTNGAKPNITTTVDNPTKESTEENSDHYQICICMCTWEHGMFSTECDRKKKRIKKNKKDSTPRQ